MLIPPHKGHRPLVRTVSLSPGVLLQQLVFYSLARCSVMSAICNLPLACALFPLAVCGVVFTSEDTISSMQLCCTLHTLILPSVPV
jgi:hypothetical protein